MENIGSQPIVTPTMITKVELIMTTRWSQSTCTEVFLRKAESRYLREPWLTTSVNTNGTIRVLCGNKSEKINIQRVKQFNDETNI